MGDKETPFNLFSSSGKKPKPEERAPARPPMPKALPRKEHGKFDARTQEMFDTIKEMQDAIVSKLDYITRKSGMTKEEVLKMVQGPGADKMEVEKMNADLKAFAEKVWGTLGDVVPKKEPKVKGTVTNKDRKGKTLGDRRNWMRMP